jgi:hypothetical protein
LKIIHHGALALEFGRREVPCVRVGRNDPFSPAYVCPSSHPACGTQPIIKCSTTSGNPCALARSEIKITSCWNTRRKRPLLVNLSKWPLTCARDQ